MIAKKPFYSQHPSIAHWNAMRASLRDRTGRSMEEWQALLREFKGTTESERRAWLKEKHRLGLSTVSLILDEAGGKGIPELDPELQIDNIFRGEKAVLRPVYEEILLFGLSLGDDVKVCPCATIVPFYRKHVFAQVKVPNRVTLHLGLALGDLPAKGMLASTGGFEKKDRITHRIEMKAGETLNKERRGWFKQAYERDRKEPSGESYLKNHG